jgi:hypothetical protein
VLQSLPSSHPVPSDTGVFWQPCVGEHESAVHSLASSQLGAALAVQVPLWHVSMPLHTLPSVHDVPSGLGASGGQVGSAPVHSSGSSHTLPGAAARHWVPAFPAVCWHAPKASQLSTVQTSPSSVHPVPAGWYPLAGQLVEVP